MFQLYSLRNGKPNSWKKPLSRGSGFFKDMNSRDDMMKIKRARAVKSRKQNQKLKEK